MIETLFYMSGQFWTVVGAGVFAVILVFAVAFAFALALAFVVAVIEALHDRTVEALRKENRI